MKYACHVYNNFIWFWYDLHGTNPDDVVFSRTTVVLFFMCRNESPPNEMKLFDDFFGTKETPEASWKDQKVKVLGNVVISKKKSYAHARSW